MSFKGLLLCMAVMLPLFVTVRDIGNGKRGNGKNGNGNAMLEVEWVGMGMIRWEWKGNGNNKVIPAHL